MRRALMRHHWRWLARGWLWTRAAPPDRRALLWATAAAGPAGGMLCLTSAAELWSVWSATDPHEPVHLSVPRTHWPGQTAQTPVRRLHRLSVPTEDICDLADLRLTKPARTCADLLRLGERLTAVVVTERVLASRGAWCQQAVQERIAGRPGARRARGLYALVDPRSQSPLETLARLILHDHGVDAPQSQYEVVTAEAGVARLDLAWPAERVAIELDGREVHALPEALYRDRQRQNGLMMAGWLVLRFTGVDLGRHPGQVAATVAQALATRRPAAVRMTAPARRTRVKR